MKSVRTTAALVLSALVLSSCTLVSTAKSPDVVNPRLNGYNLLSKTIPGTNHGRVRWITQPVYMIDATGHLTASSRIVPSPPTIASVLTELVIGPTDNETSVGYTSALPSDLVILQAVVRQHLGYIDVAKSLSKLPHRQQILAIGQLVWTAYWVGATRGIEIQVEGVTERLLTPTGSSEQQVTRSDYLSLTNT